MGATTDIEVGGTAGAGGREPIGHSACTKWLTECFYLLRQRFLETVSKSVPKDKLAAEKTEEAKAYKKLMEVLEGEPKEKPIDVIKWIINVTLLVIFIILLTTFASLHVIHKERVFHMRIHSWVALLMVVVSGCPFMYALTYFISEMLALLVWLWKMDKYVFFFARQLKGSVAVTLWSTLVLWVWYTWFRSQVVKDIRGFKALHVSEELYKEELKVVVKQITRFLMAISIGALIWTIKSAVFLRVIADLHFTELCERIRQAILDLHGIQFIEKERWHFLTRIETSQKDTDEGGTVTLEESGNTNMTGNINSGNVVGKNDSDDVLSFWMCVSRLKKKTAPIWILQRLTYTFMEHMKRKPEILRRLENIDDDEKLVEEAKEMLKKVIKDHGPDDDITRNDLGKYGLRDKEIDNIIELFASKDYGNPRDIITQDQFLRWAVLAVKNCLGLERTIESSEHVFWKLKILMDVCVVVITLVIWLLLSELVNTGQMAILFTPFVSASFVFGDSFRRFFDGIIFVFGMHPFDVGDRVIIEDVEMKVSEIKIMTTIFIKYDTGVEAIYPNSELSTKVIVNLEITPDQPDIIEFTMPFDTPQELICDLQVKIKKLLDDDLTYTSNTAVAKKMLSDTEVTLIVYFKYLVSYLSAETKAQHRSRIFCKIIRLKKQIIKMMKERKEQENSSEVVAGILRFTIDVKVKLSTIEKLKDKILGALHSYKPILKDSSQVLFTGINKKKIVMDVKMNYPKDLFTKPNEQNEVKKQIEKAIGDGSVLPQTNQEEEKKVKVEWLENSDWDDHC